MGQLAGIGGKLRKFVALSPVLVPLHRGFVRNLSNGV
jgi:hypothetical protein